MNTSLLAAILGPGLPIGTSTATYSRHGANNQGKPRNDRPGTGITSQHAAFQASSFERVVLHQRDEGHEQAENHRFHE